MQYRTNSVVYELQDWLKFFKKILMRLIFVICVMLSSDFAWQMVKFIGVVLWCSDIPRWKWTKVIYYSC